MKVFVTGSTGFLGFAIVQDLIKAGHQVTGLARSSQSAKALQVVGASVRQGDIENLNLLRAAAQDADGVIHTAFYHQISHVPLGTRLKVLMGGLPTGIVSRFMGAAIGADRRAFEVMGQALKRNGGPLVAAFPTLAMEPGVLAKENDLPSSKSAGAQRGTNEAALRKLAPDVRSSIVRLPPVVHGAGDRNGLLPQLITIAKKTGKSGYVGEGANRWAAVHKLDAARLFRLALEAGRAGEAYHAVAVEGISFREIAEALGSQVGVPAVSVSPSEAGKQFGFLSAFVAADNPVSSARTQQRLDWQPGQPNLFADLRPSYFDGPGAS